MEKKKTITLLKFVNPTNKDIDTLSANEVHKIKPINDKEGKIYLMVDYYDCEYCLNSTFFCESIELETKVIEKNNSY